LPLDLDPKDVLIPKEYKDNNKPESGYDIALIGLSKENKEKVVKYLKNLQK